MQIRIEYKVDNRASRCPRRSLGVLTMRVILAYLIPEEDTVKIRQVCKTIDSQHQSVIESCLKRQHITTVASPRSDSVSFSHTVIHQRCEKENGTKLTKQFHVQVFHQTDKQTAGWLTVRNEACVSFARIRT